MFTSAWKLEAFSVEQGNTSFSPHFQVPMDILPASCLNEIAKALVSSYAVYVLDHSCFKA